jgi:hypothetical protein
MDIIEIFGVQLLLSVVVFGLFATWYVNPWLNKQDSADALLWLTLPHAFRHIGLVFLVPGIVAPTIPSTFSAAAGYGDLAAGLLAILALVALRQRWNVMIPLVWLLNIVGTVDLANALSHIEVVSYLQSAWYIPTFLVPLLLVTHFMMFARLLSLARTTLTSAASRA